MTITSNCLRLLLFLLLMLAIPGVWAQGPPYQTDDPTPVDFKHYEASPPRKFPLDRSDLPMPQAHGDEPNTLCQVFLANREFLFPALSLILP